ncbi:MAG TPA: hypothetical protein VMK12_13125, partial [Anaeromyxobacteraceae bacterium]|nr:hypothetical protein [Anaeromyxobacteraceae bacterium]
GFPPGVSPRGEWKAPGPCRVVWSTAQGSYNPLAMLQRRDVGRISRAIRDANPPRDWFPRWLRLLFESGRELGLLWVAFGVLDAAIGAALSDKAELAIKASIVGWRWVWVGGALAFLCVLGEALLSGEGD